MNPNALGSKIRLKTSLCSLCPTNTSTFICAGVDFAAGLRLHHQPFVVQFYQSGIAQPALWRARRGLWSERAQWPPSPADPISSGGTLVFNPKPDSKATSLSQVWLVIGNEVKGEGRASIQTANLIKVNACEKKTFIDKVLKFISIQLGFAWGDKVFSFPYVYIWNTSKAMYRLLEIKW